MAWKLAVTEDYTVTVHVYTDGAMGHYPESYPCSGGTEIKV